MVSLALCLRSSKMVVVVMLMRATGKSRPDSTNLEKQLCSLEELRASPPQSQSLLGPWTDGDARRLRMSDAAKRSGSKRSEAFFCFDGLKSFVVGKQREEVFPAGQRPKMAPEVAGQTAKRPLPGGQVERLLELLPGPSSGPTVRIEAPIVVDEATLIVGPGTCASYPMKDFSR
eukprot:s849_g5.t1